MWLYSVILTAIHGVIKCHAVVAAHTNLNTHIMHVYRLGAARPLNGLSVESLKTTISKVHCQEDKSLGRPSRDRQTKKHMFKILVGPVL